MSEVSSQGSEHYGTWRHESGKPGHEAEICLHKVLRKFVEANQLYEVAEEDFGKQYDKDAFFVASQETDEAEGLDLGYYTSTNNEWHKIDLTVARDHTEKWDKQKKNAQRGIKTMESRLYDLKLASQSTIYGERNQSLDNVLNDLERALAS